MVSRIMVNYSETRINTPQNSIAIHPTTLHEGRGGGVWS